MMCMSLDFWLGVLPLIWSIFWNLNIELLIWIRGNRFFRYLIISS